MVLVDTSVLIPFFNGKKIAEVNKLEYIIKNNIPFGINDYIYQELLQGSKTEKEFSILNDYLKTQRFYYLLYGRQSYENASLIYFNCRRNGITVRSTIDLLIVETAIENNLKLLHIDNDFYNIGKIIKELTFF